MDIKGHIQKKLQDILVELKFEILPEVKISDDSSHGDYYSNVAMRAAGVLKKNPLETAREISSKFEPDEYVSKVEAVSPGFINFWVSEKYLLENLVKIESEKERFGFSSINNGKKVVVEFSSPNIAKPFTVGHLRSTIIGNTVANLLRATGWDVITDNHLGDWGTQFGKQIYAIKMWGNEEEIEKAENPVKELVALYVRFHEEAEKDTQLEEYAREWFRKLEEGDAEARRIWQKCIDWSMAEFDRLYALLGVSFDTTYGESFYEDKMQLVIQELSDRGLLKKSEGADLVFFPDDKYPPLMILKSDGATLYATRDLATDKFRFEKYGKDTVIINEVGAEQSLYFQQLFQAEIMLAWVKEGQRIHLRHGLYRFKDQKMSTRKGNTIWLEEVLEEAEKKAHSLISKSHDIQWEDVHVDTKSKDKTPTLKMSEIINNDKSIGIGAIKWNDLKRDHIQDIVFDWDDILNMHGNSGPYMQYSFVRIKSLLEKGKNIEYIGQNNLHNLEAEELLLLRMLSYYPVVIEDASVSFSTSILCNYLFSLAQAFNLFYQKYSILGEDDKNKFRLRLSASTGQVIKNGLHLLGIETVEKM